MHEGLIIPLAGIMLPLILVPTIITLKQRFKKREWQHQERLRALDLGLPAGEQEPRLGAGTVTAIGAGVPVASVLAAFLTSVSIHSDNHDFLEVLAVTWGCAFLISSAALVTSLVFGIMLMRSRKAAEVSDGFATAKPAYDPDAYDVVSSRG
jgi:hypothetical protein